MKVESLPSAAERVFGNLDAAKGILFVRIDEDYGRAKQLITRLNSIGLEVGEINLSETEVTVTQFQREEAET